MRKSGQSESRFYFGNFVGINGKYVHTTSAALCQVVLQIGRCCLKIYSKPSLVVHNICLADGRIHITVLYGVYKFPYYLLGVQLGALTNAIKLGIYIPWFTDNVVI